MSPGSDLAAVAQLTRDTFRQACASGICGMMLAITATCAVLCLSVGVSGDVTLHAEGETTFFLPPPSARAAIPPGAASEGGGTPLGADPELARREGIETIGGRVTLAFGAVSFPLGRDRGDAVRFLELLLAWGAAGTLGLLMALIWTAGFLPTFLEPGVASVLLTKPIARWQLLLGKYIGVLIFVGSQVVLFVALTWLGLGLRTRVWDTTYWWSIPLLLLQFSVFYSASVLLAVLTRSTVACAFGAILFWLLSWGINYGRVMARGLSESRDLPPLTSGLVETAYAIFPKPIDSGLILFNALDAGHHFEKPVLFTLLESGGAFSPHLSILSSLALTGALLALSAHEFRAKDY